MSDYDYVSAKLGPISDATRSKSREIFDAAKAAGHDIWYMWGYDGDASNTEHHSGRALDLMVKNEAAGDWVRDYIWANRDRLRVLHVIWEQHITSTVTQPGVRRKMSDRGNSTANHYDHNHVLFFDGAYVAPGGGTPPNTGGGKSVTDVAKDVLAGKYGNGHERIDRLRTDGYDPAAVQAEVNRLLAGDPPVRKTVSQLANEVLAGQWGNGDDRVNRLRSAGYDPAAVQAEVNRVLTGNRPSTKKTNAQMANEVIAGKWGNDPERSRKLRAAGYDPEAIQREVNRRV